jgi:GT2 family glycosyltransferase
MSTDPITPRVSLLLPNRDNAPILQHVLECLARHTDYPDFELLVVDDGSTDGSLELLRDWREGGRFADFRLIEHEHTSEGVIAALNTGLAQATGELVVQLDADASIETPGWLRRMVSFFTSDPRIGVVTAKIVFDSGELHTCGVDLLGPDGFHDRGAVITEPPGHRTYHQRVLRSREKDCPVCDVLAEVDGGIGCCMMYRRDVAIQLGGYDPGYAPVWFDDLDLTLAIRQAGLKVFYLPEVRVVHHVARRLDDDPVLARTRQRLRRRIGSVLPASLRRRIIQRLGIDRPPPEQWRRLERHYAYWRRKWGYDMLNPDLDAVRMRWGDTEICWRFNPEMLAAGEQIIAAFAAARPAVERDR